MKTLTKTLYQCDFCSFMSEDENQTQQHEEVCPQNPVNQPCSTCVNMLIGAGCTRNIDIEKIRDNVHCFCYEEGLPQYPINVFMEKLIQEMSKEPDPDNSNN